MNDDEQIKENKTINESSMEDKINIPNEETENIKNLKFSDEIINLSLEEEFIEILSNNPKNKLVINTLLAKYSQKKNNNKSIKNKRLELEKLEVDYTRIMSKIDSLIKDKEEIITSYDSSLKEKMQEIENYALKAQDNIESNVEKLKKRKIKTFRLRFFYPSFLFKFQKVNEKNEEIKEKLANWIEEQKEKFDEISLNAENLLKDYHNFINQLNKVELPKIDEKVYKNILIELNNNEIALTEVEKNKLVARTEISELEKKNHSLDKEIDNLRSKFFANEKKKWLKFIDQSIDKNKK